MSPGHPRHRSSDAQGARRPLSSRWAGPIVNRKGAGVPPARRSQQTACSVGHGLSPLRVFFCPLKPQTEIDVITALMVPAWVCGLGCVPETRADIPLPHSCPTPGTPSFRPPSAPKHSLSSLVEGRPPAERWGAPVCSTPRRSRRIPARQFEMRHPERRNCCAPQASPSLSLLSSPIFPRLSRVSGHMPSARQGCPDLARAHAGPYLPAPACVHLHARCLAKCPTSPCCFPSIKIV